jgi:hypothetical protein
MYITAVGEAVLTAVIEISAVSRVSRAGGRRGCGQGKARRLLLGRGAAALDEARLLRASVTA